MKLNSLKHAREIAGSVSLGNGKMPGGTMPTDPFACETGSKLRKVAGSVCASCYACRLAKFRPNVGAAWARNENFARTASRPEWIASMVYQIGWAVAKTGEPYFRWFDAGDLSSPEHLDRIAEVCRETPTVLHWLPTREIGHVRAWLESGASVPRNLCIRISSTMWNEPPRKIPAAWNRRGIRTSTVHRHKDGAPVGNVCPASTQGGQCGDCRACWDRSTANTSYPLH